MSPEQRVNEIADEITKSLASEEATERRANFLPLINESFQCPTCWMFKDSASDLVSYRNKGGEAAQYDYFWCGDCKTMVDVPLRR